MSKGKRHVPAEDRALFWQAMNSGATLKEAAKIAGINYRTAINWSNKAKRIKAEVAEVELLEGKEAATHGGGRAKKIGMLHTRLCRSWSRTTKSSWF